MFSGLSQNVWVNLAGFQIVWWSSVLLQHRAVLIVAPLLLAHLLLHRTPQREARLMLVGGVCGYAVDTLLMHAGVFAFVGAEMLAPLWLLLLWLGFCATLNQSLRLFAGRYTLALLCGAIGGSTTYVAAAQLGAAQLGLPIPLTLAVLAALWALLFPALILLRDQQAQGDLRALG
jgi:hypothetical protein